MIDCFWKIKRKIKFTWQIWTRGWCDCDIWNLDISLSSIILSRLKRFKELKCGCPYFLTMAQWDEILDQMINAFKIIENKFKDNSSSIKDMNKKEEEVQKGFDLFNKYFSNLWM